MIDNEKDTEATVNTEADEVDAEAVDTEPKSETELALEKAERELAELNDKYLRLAAEYDNFRKRSQKEKDAIYTDAVADTIAQILPVLDNLERASMYTEADKVAEGLGLITRDARAMLSHLSVTEFGEAGEAFDPNIHNAVMHIEDENYDEATIIEVFQKGYRKGDKIIRYAMVKVAN